MKNTDRSGILVSFLALLFICVPPAAAQEFALKALEASPRHQEWVDVPSKGRTILSFVVYPEVSENTLAVIVIHENRGLTDWERSVADQLAAAGFLAIAPDLLSDFDSTHKRTSDFASLDESRAALSEVPQEQVTADLLAVERYIAAVPSSNGKTVVMGFCWGGAQAFRFAADSSQVAASLVFYGRPPPEGSIAELKAPVYGFYGESDQRINDTIPQTESLMKTSGKAYDYVIYPGAGHAFLRQGDDPQAAEPLRKARDEAWQRVRAILAEVETK